MYLRIDYIVLISVPHTYLILLNIFQSPGSMYTYVYIFLKKSNYACFQDTILQQAIKLKVQEYVIFKFLRLKFKENSIWRVDCFKI